LLEKLSSYIHKRNRRFLARAVPQPQEFPVSTKDKEKAGTIPEF
jgi:hypothetical protein